MGDRRCIGVSPSFPWLHLGGARYRVGGPPPSTPYWLHTLSARCHSGGSLSSSSRYLRTGFARFLFRSPVPSPLCWCTLSLWYPRCCPRPPRGLQRLVCLPTSPAPVSPTCGTQARCAQAWRRLHCKFPLHAHLCAPSSPSIFRALQCTRRRRCLLPACHLLSAASCGVLLGVPVG